jgi:hypothetical protein
LFLEFLELGYELPSGDPTRRRLLLLAEQPPLARLLDVQSKCTRRITHDTLGSLFAVQVPRRVTRYPLSRRDQQGRKLLPLISGPPLDKHLPGQHRGRSIHVRFERQSDTAVAWHIFQ